ncbi:MAG: hypothetical protein WDO18_11560 [Acidobacteriota bacterium]
METQISEAHEESKKGATMFWIEGASSTAKTPLAEPIFIIRTEKLNPEKLELYRMEINKSAGVDVKRPARAQ